MALEIAGPICVEQTQIAQEVRNDFANRTDDLDDFPAPTNAGSRLAQLEIGNTHAGGTPSTLAGNRQSTPAGESTLASDRQCTQPSKKKRSNPTAANDAGPGSKRRKIKVCLLNVSTL
jgi:hypothetical protein